MFIALYPAKKLKRLKNNLLLTGLFLAAGGTFALIRELQSGTTAPGMVIAAAIVLVTGLVCVAVSQDVLPLKDAYFLMNPTRVGFRLTLLGNEQILPWADVAALKITENSVVFNLQNSKKVIMHLNAIPDVQVARHIRASIRLAALEQDIEVNGVELQAKAMQLAS